MEDEGQSRKNRQTPAFLGISFPWFIAAAGCTLFLISAMNQNTYGVFFKPIATEFGWSRGEVSGAYAVRSLAAAVFVAPMGYWSDRHGPRWVLLFSFLFLGIGLLLTAKVTAAWHLYPVQGLFMGIGAAGPFVCLTATVGKWHDKRRGLALGVVAMGSGLATIIFPPLATKLIESMGWRDATIVLGLATLAIGMPGSMVMRNPQDPAQGQSDGGRSEHRSVYDIWRMLPRFLKDRVFLPIFLMFFLLYTASWLVISHLINYATDVGITPLLAATMMSVLGVGSVAGRLAMGFIGDRIGIKADAIMCVALVIASLLLFIWKASITMWWIAAIMFGLGFGGFVPLIPELLGDRFGTKYLGTLTGITMVGAFVGAALGPWLGGIIFDISHSYLGALALAGTFSVVSLMFALSLRAATHEMRERAQVLLE